jgi:hypothetical protein
MTKFFLRKRSRVTLVIAFWLALFGQAVCAQNVPGNPRYYDNLMDSIFRDVENVVQLGMDYAVNNEKRVEGDFIEWVSGRDIKNPEQDDYFQAMHTLHEGWELLLKGGKIYQQMRRRQINDAETERLREQSAELRRQGTIKVREAENLRRLADNKRNARLQAEKEKAERQKAAVQTKNLNDVKSLSAEFQKLNQEEEAENKLYERQQGIAASEPNLRKRQVLVDAENVRHERRMNEINKKRDALIAKMDAMIRRQRQNPQEDDPSQEPVPPDH